MATKWRIQACILLCLMLAGIFSSADSVTVSLFEAESNSPGPADEFAQVTRSVASSKIECAALCATRSDCLTFIFSPASSECQMSNEEPGGLATDGLPVYNSRLRHRAATGSPCMRTVVATKDGRHFCPIQQRVSDSNFQRSWSAYETGFGDDVNFWVGLQVIHQLSSQHPDGSAFLVQLITWHNEKIYQVYRNFRVQDASSKYTMTVGPLEPENSNLVLNRLSDHNGMMFSTTDRDNDKFGGSCSNVYHGSSGWWFNTCASSNPNGIYAPGELIQTWYISWRHDSSWTSLKATRLSLSTD